MASGISTTNVTKQTSNIVAGVVDNSFINNLELMEISAGVRKLPSIAPEFDNFLYQDFGPRIGMVEQMKMSGRVVNIGGTEFTTFSEVAPYRPFAIAENGTGVGIAAQATPGGNITFKLESTAYLNGKDPIMIGQDIHLPVAYTKISGSVTTVPVPFQVISRTSTVGNSATVWTAKPYDALVTVDAIAIGKEIIPQGFGGARGGKPKGGFTNSDKQQSWKTSLRTGRFDFEEGTVMREEVFSNIPTQVFRMVGVGDRAGVRFINPNMKSPVGRALLLNKLLFEKDLEQTFLYGANNTNSVTDTKESGATANIQAGKGALTILHEQGIQMPRTGAIELGDLQLFEQACRKRGFMGHVVDVYAGPDANMEIATAWQTFVKDYNPSEIATGSTYSVVPTVYRFGQFEARLHLVDSWGDPNGLGAEGFGLHNRIVVVPQEESNTLVGDSVLNLPNLALLQNKTDMYDRSYMVADLKGFTELGGPIVKDWGNNSIVFKGEIGVCAPSMIKVIDCPRS